MKRSEMLSELMLVIELHYIRFNADCCFGELAEEILNCCEGAGMLPPNENGKTIWHERNAWDLEDNECGAV